MHTRTRTRPFRVRRRNQGLRGPLLSVLVVMLAWALLPVSFAGAHEDHEHGASASEGADDARNADVSATTATSVRDAIVAEAAAVLSGDGDDPEPLRSTEAPVAALELIPDIDTTQPEQDQSGVDSNGSPVLVSGDTAPTPGLVITEANTAAVTAGDVEGFTFTPIIADGLARPTIVREAPDGALFVAEKGGSLKVYEPGSAVGTTVATLPAHADGDLGLLGFTLHPDFPTTPVAYGLMAADDGGIREGQLVKLNFDADARTVLSAEVLVDNWCGTYDFHGPSYVEFGPDGALYTSAGDYYDWADGPTFDECGDPEGLEGGFRSQDYQDSPSPGVGDDLGLDGTIARFQITADGYIDTTSDVAHEQVIAYGLRDAVRFAFSPDGTMFISDDGIYTEEVNIIESPAHPASFGEPINFGWPCFEGAGLRRPEAGLYAEVENLGPCLDDGSVPQLDLSDDVVGMPVHQYSGHGNRITSIAFLPDEESYGAWAGALVFADWGNERVSVVPYKGGHDYFWESAEVIASDLKVDHLEVTDSGRILYAGLSRDESDVLSAEVGSINYVAPPEKPGRFKLDTPFVLLNDIGQPIEAPTVFEYSPVPGDSSIFVATKNGQVWRYDSWGDPSGDLIVDLSTLLDPAGDPVVFGTFGDQGLLSMALHPNFVDEPWIYLLFTTGEGDGGAGGGGTLQRFMYDPDTAPADVVLEELVGVDADATAADGVTHHYWCQETPAHPIADVNFGPDGKLYVSAGEGSSPEAADNGELAEAFYSYDCNDPVGEGGAMRAQDLATQGDPLGYGGTMIRLNPDGSIPADNPNVSLTPAYADDDAIIAYGMRMPWRFGIHPYTSEIFVSNVGWDTSESLFHIPDATDDKVENFGWPCYEGAAIQPRFQELNSPICNNLYANEETAWTPPLLAYALPGGQAASGLRIYFGGAGYPQEYDGALFWSDYAGNFIKAIPAVETPDGTTYDTNDIRDVIVDEFIIPIDLKIGRDGAVTFLDIFASTLTKVVYSQSPSVAIEANQTAGILGTTFELDASSLFDTEGVDVITWDLDRDGDYSDATGPSVSFTPAENGTYLVRAIATDPTGGIGSFEIQLTVGNTPPEIEFSAPVIDAEYSLDDLIDFELTATDADAEGNVTTLDGTRVDVEFVLHHCEGPIVGEPAQDGDGLVEDCHEHYVADVEGTDSGQFVPAPHSLPSRWVLRATATEPDRADWGQAEYRQRRTITFDPAGWIGSANTFVAPIVIEGSDLGVYDDVIILDDTDTPVPLVSEDATQKRTIWAQFPADVAGRTFTMYYDRTSAAACPPDCTESDPYGSVTGLVGVIDGNEFDEEGVQSGLQTASDLFDSVALGADPHSAFPTLATSPWGNAMVFDPAELSMVRTAYEPSQDEDDAGPLTWTLWLKPASVPSFLEGQDAILSTDNGGFDWSIVRSGEHWSVFDGATQSEFDETSPTPLPVLWEEWQMLTLTVDPVAGEMTFYHNTTGVTVAMTAANFTPFTGNVTLGNAAGTNGDGSPWNMWFKGEMDNVRFYERVLSADEITDLYNAQLPAEYDPAGYRIAGLVDIGQIEQPAGLSTTSDYTVEPIVARFDVDAMTADGDSLDVAVSVFSDSRDTPFVQSTMKGTDVSMTVPAMEGGLPFDHWLITDESGAVTEDTANPLFVNSRDPYAGFVAVYGTPTEPDPDLVPPSDVVCDRPHVVYDRFDAETSRRYRAFFGRNPGAAGLDYWRSDPEAAVFRLQTAILNRVPDNEGLAYWNQAHNRGHSLSELAGAMLMADEAVQRWGVLSDEEFVTEAYCSILGRAPEPRGAGFWHAQLASGTSRGAVIAAFSESAEFVIATGTLP